MASNRPRSASDATKDAPPSDENQGLRRSKSHGSLQAEKKGDGLFPFSQCKLLIFSAKKKKKGFFLWGHEEKEEPETPKKAVRPPSPRFDKDEFYAQEEKLTIDEKRQR